MQINVTTFAGRKQHYIHDMMRSLFESDWQETKPPINLIMGSEDESHVREYASHPAIRIVPWDETTHPKLRVNCTLNKIRALHYGEDDLTVICEDDITFSPNWITSLKLAAAEMGDEDYLLSLFAAREKLEKASLLDGKTLIKHYPIRYMCGAQAVFYPSKALRQGAARYLTVNLLKGCGDHLIGRYALASAALYATKDCLVDHIGGISCFHPKG